MNKNIQIAGLAILVGLLSDCKEKDDNQVLANDELRPVRIMPLGASRVDGAPPLYESYRYDLWKLLLDGGHSFDFVGLEKDDFSYPMYNGASFDIDHEGRGGINSTGILEEIKRTLSVIFSPDIVLFSSPGGNDGIAAYSQTLMNIKAIIDEFQANNSNVIIYLELPAPPLTLEQTSEFTAYYNQALQDLPGLAEEKNTATSKVLTIDMTAEVGFKDDFLADDVHYNAAGAKFVADRYYEELSKVLK